MAPAASAAATRVLRLAQPRAALILSAVMVARHTAVRTPLEPPTFSTREGRRQRRRRQRDCSASPSHAPQHPHLRRCDRRRQGHRENFWNHTQSAYSRGTGSVSSIGGGSKNALCLIPYATASPLAAARSGRQGRSFRATHHLDIYPSGIGSVSSIGGGSETALPYQATRCIVPRSGNGSSDVRSGVKTARHLDLISGDGGAPDGSGKAARRAL